MPKILIIYYFRTSILLDSNNILSIEPPKWIIIVFSVKQITF